MDIQVQGNRTVVDTPAYRLELANGLATSNLADKATRRFFAFVCGGACNAVDAFDNVSDISEWMVVSSNGGEAVLERKEKSSVWNVKTTRLHLFEDAIEFQYELKGRHAVEDIRFFRPVINGVEFGFCGDIDEIYSTAPNFQDRQYYHPVDTVAICYGNDLDVRTGSHALASTPHVMALHDRRDTGYLTASVFAAPGNYLWDEMLWNPKISIPPTWYHGDDVIGGGFSIGYHGKLTVDGAWTSPSLCLTFASSEDRVLPDALEYAYRRSYLPRPGRHPHPKWWEEPIYCTWHDQCALSEKGMLRFTEEPEHPQGTFCTQANVDEWLGHLEANDCHVGTVVLDDKWQENFSSAEPNKERWPDLRGWIDSLHAKGMRVSLWWPAWFEEGVPEEAAITRDGKIVCGDPTNPKYEAILREMFRRFLSDEPDGLNADAVKIDGLMCLPVGHGLKNHDNLWGLELQRRLLEICYNAAHKTKNDACIGLFAGHPYLDSFMDMVRLADLYTWRTDTMHTADVRFRLYRTTNPNVLVDSDGHFLFTIGPNYLESLDHARQLGCIPTLYTARHLLQRRFLLPPAYKTLDASDYKGMADILKAYRAEHE